MIRALLLLCVAIIAINVNAGERRDINDVLRAHDRELLAIPGVVGVAVALLPDNRTPCLRVMLTRETPESKQIPRELEGYPVVKQVSGEFRPLGH